MGYISAWAAYAMHVENQSMQTGKTLFILAQQ